MLNECLHDIIMPGRKIFYIWVLEAFGMIELKSESIGNKRELEFAVFCIENVAIELGVSAERIYDALTVQSDILNGYIIPCYEVLHSQSKEYIVEDIIALMKKRGILI